MHIKRVKKILNANLRFSKGRKKPIFVNIRNTPDPEPGSYGQVVFAYDQMNEREMAIKIAYDAIGSVDDHSARKFRREQQELVMEENLNCPYLINVYDYGIPTFNSIKGAVQVIKNYPVLFMEPAEENFRSKIADQPMNLDEFFVAFPPILKGASHLNNQDKYHRDITLGNMFDMGKDYAGESQFKLGDLSDMGYGFPTHSGSGSGKKVIGTMIATPPEALESVLKNPEDHSQYNKPTSDVYFLGHSGIRLLTQIILFHDPELRNLSYAEKPGRLVEAKRNIDLNSIKIPGASEGLTKLLRAMINPDPAKRPQTVDEVLKAMTSPIVIKGVDPNDLKEKFYTQLSEIETYSDDNKARQSWQQLQDSYDDIEEMLRDMLKDDEKSVFFNEINKKVIEKKTMELQNICNEYDKKVNNIISKGKNILSQEEIDRAMRFVDSFYSAAKGIAELPLDNTGITDKIEDMKTRLMGDIDQRVIEDDKAKKKELKLMKQSFYASLDGATPYNQDPVSAAKDWKSLEEEYSALETLAEEYSQTNLIPDVNNRIAQKKKSEVQAVFADYAKKIDNILKEEKTYLNLTCINDILQAKNDFYSAAERIDALPLNISQEIKEHITVSKKRFDDIFNEEKNSAMTIIKNRVDYIARNKNKYRYKTDSIIEIENKLDYFMEVIAAWHA